MIMISRISRNVTAIYIVFGVIATFIVVSIYYTYEKLENISTSGSSGGLVLVKSKFRGARMSVSNVVSASMVTTQNLSMGAVVQIVRIKSADLNENFGSFTYIKISTFLNSFINQILNYARKENVTDSSLYAANTTHPSNMVTSNGSNSDFFPTLVRNTFEIWKLCILKLYKNDYVRYFWSKGSLCQYLQFCNLQCFRFGIHPQN